MQCLENGEDYNETKLLDQNSTFCQTLKPHPDGCSMQITKLPFLVEMTVEGNER